MELTGGGGSPLLRVTGLRKRYPSFELRDVSLEVAVTLYFDLGEGTYFADSVVLENVLLHTNDGGENVSFLAVPLDLFVSTGPLAGFGISYEYREDPASSEFVISANAEEKTEGHFGLLLYEFTLPGWTLEIF